MFLLKVLPMLPSKPLNMITPTPIVELLQYETSTGAAEGDVYRPSGRGRHPGVVVCLGVVPFGVDHPQVPRLGEALARSGFAALLYWSPAMREFRLDEEDIENIARAYEQLVEQPYVDERRSGLLGTCVGGSFALMASANERIRHRVNFVAAFAPYASLHSLARDIVSATCVRDGSREPWQVDPLTRTVFVHSVTAHLSHTEAERLRELFLEGSEGQEENLSADASAIRALLSVNDPDDADLAIKRLPDDVRKALAKLSPVNYVSRIKAPTIAISHDRDDTVIPVGESRQLTAALGSRQGLHYAEFAMFQHADPTKRKLSPIRLVQQLSKFYLWLHGVFVATEPSRSLPQAVAKLSAERRGKP